MRNFCYIQQIEKLLPIENADKIEIAKIKRGFFKDYSIVYHFRDATKMGGYFRNGKNHLAV
jgi:hypothetical protein